MAHIFENERRSITLDSIESVQGFNNTTEGVRISIIKEKGIIEPTEAFITPEVNPTGGLEIVGEDIQIVQNDTTVQTDPLKLNPIINKKITSVEEPTEPQDAATKNYADTNIPPPVQLGFDYTTTIHRDVIDVAEESLVRTFGQTPMSTYAPQWTVQGNTPTVAIVNTSGTEKEIYRLTSDVNGSNVIIGEIPLDRFQSCHLYGGYIGMEIATTTSTTDANVTIRVPGSNTLLNMDGSTAFTSTPTIGLELDVKLENGTVRIDIMDEFGDAVEINLNGTSVVTAFDLDGESRNIRVPLVEADDLFEIRIYCTPSANNSEGLSEGGVDGGGLSGLQFIFVRRIDNDNNNPFVLIGNTNYISKQTAGIPRITFSAGAITQFNTTIDIKSFGIVVNNTQMSKDFTRAELEGKHELQIHIPEFLGNITLGFPPSDSISNPFKIVILSELHGQLILEGSEEDGLENKDIFSNKKRYVTTQRDLGRPKEIIYNNTGGGTFSDFTLVKDEPDFTALKIDGGTGNITTVYSKHILQDTKLSTGTYLIFNSGGQWVQEPYVFVTPQRPCIYRVTTQPNSSAILINTTNIISQLGIDSDLNVIIQDVN